jgi:hypothetical protein
MKTLVRVLAVAAVGATVAVTGIVFAGPALADMTTGHRATRPATKAERTIDATLSGSGTGSASASARATDSTGYAGYSKTLAYRTCLTVRGALVAYNIQWVNHGAPVVLRSFLQMANNGKFFHDPGYYNVLVRVPTTPTGQFAYVGRTWTTKAAVNTTWAAVGQCTTPNTASAAARVVSPTLRVT